MEPHADYESQERGPTGVRKGEHDLCARETLRECVVNGRLLSMAGSREETVSHPRK